MKKLAVIFLIFLTVGTTVNGQENPIAEFDLYGCWILERNEDGSRPRKLIYKRCEDSNPKLTIKSSEISLLAYNESEEQMLHPYICPVTYTEKGTWEYDVKNGLIIMYRNKKVIKELKEKHPEEFAKFGSPKRLVSNKFRIVKLSKSRLEVEKLSTTKPMN
ncbi:hypothetical protein [Zobellia alginiliquefaciens]|uniref:hypothetical protein n=1 Tax=Zobellia alginiliquefaciens TaxID=3032586 RepID=UPI0023E39CEC|nr:hypothetical protein [Zobellia alginiliquefaciens]